MALQGKGFFIWQISRCEAGNAQAIAAAGAQAGLTHVLIKIADGIDPYNINSSTGQDLVPPVVAALRNRNIICWGWHYVYGYEPVAEADVAIQRLQTLGLDGYAIDAEAPYKQPGRDEAARQFMSRLRASLPDFPIALSSYRYPTYHPQLPWREFLEKCDFNMPQVYWVEAHNPGEQLIRSLREFEAMEPFRPLIPTGSAYKQGDWQPTVADINEFLDTARNLNLSAANFWEWGHTRLYLPHLWDAIAAYNWPVEPQGEIVERYFAALNAHAPAQVTSLYHDAAVLVTGKRTRQGSAAIRAYYRELFNQVLPGAEFNLVEYSGDSVSRHFTWMATSSAGNVSNGDDTLGLVGGKIVYHYTYFTISPP
ncbi:MAG: nuclear transport factor 2 family protein [Anaerolineales bacterium]|nr:nuclear transport factor 2 family protein [Anaerolineales bacterium]